MPLADAVRLQHMLDAARKALQYTEGRSRAILDTDEVLALAVVRLLEIVGEAAKGVSPMTTAQASGIPWKQLAGMRDRLAHGYFDVNLDIVWQIVTYDLPELVTQLERLLTGEAGGT